MDEIINGRYRHYKGNEYSVLGVARHSETLEEVVVYRQEYGERGLWVRPKQMFLEAVKVDGHEMPRFRHLTSERENSQPVTNLFHNLALKLPAEVAETIFASAHFRIERIVSTGQASPEGFWFDQEQHEWVVVLKGAARLRIEGEQPVELQPGDFINIAAHTKHRVEWTTPNEPTIWLAVHYGDQK